jgi:uncharacterized damage-inducible protein DinB
MKSYFIRLLNYDHFANTKIAELIMQTGATGKPVETMAHLLTAQQTWLKRLKKTSAPLTPLWPNWSAETFITIIDNNHQQFLAYLEMMQPHDFDGIIEYKNSVGDFKSVVSDVLAHLINHGTHHRAQIGTLLKMGGATLPGLDYVLYIRNLNQTV